MAEPLKNMYSPAFFESIVPVLRKTLPGFQERRFIHAIFDRSWPDLALKQRVRHITQALHPFMPPSFPEAAEKLKALSEAFRQQAMPEQGFALIFLPDYIEVYGQNHVDHALDAMETVTQLVSAEFAIRSFLLADAPRTLKRMLRWSKHPHASVRRLASEGCRPRLPWGMAVPALKQDPNLTLPILENLKNDPALYVRKSVANHLNDHAKDHPDFLLAVAQRWQGKSSETDWIIRHASRTLLKKGNQHALTLQGINPQSRARIDALTLSKKTVKVGDRLNFSFSFISQEKKETTFRLEYQINYLTATGKTSEKVFKIAEKTYAPGEAVTIQRHQSFQDYTTRRHHKGKHSLIILVNGKKQASAEFMIS